jgi:hypothetical protein
VALDRISEIERAHPRIFVKLEYFSPGGSIKGQGRLEGDRGSREGRGADS